MKICASSSAEITWSAGSDNNSPITAYIVLYNTTYDDQPASLPLREAATVNGSARSASVRPLSPWTGYSFYVVAQSAVGRSELVPVGGGDSAVVCRTPGSRPGRSPRRVCTDNRLPGQLVVVWEVSRSMDRLASLSDVIVTASRRSTASRRINDRVHSVSKEFRI